MRTVQLPDDLAAQAAELALRQNKTLDEVVAAAVSTQVSADKDIAALRARAARGDLKALDRILASVPDVPPLPGDEL